MGLKDGEAIERICPIIVTAVWQERLSELIKNGMYGKSEAASEGFPEMTGQEFVRMFCKHMQCTANQIVTRIEFRYLPGGLDVAAVRNSES